MQAFITALVSPERLFRAGLRSVLVQAGHNVVGEWDSIQAVESFSADQTVLVLLDAALAGPDLAEHVLGARDRFDRALIVVLGNEARAENIRAARTAGASGFVAKDSSSQELLGLLDKVAQGQSVFPRIQEIVELPLTQDEAEKSQLVEKPDPRELCKEMGLLAAINTCRKHRWTDLLRVIQAEREAALAVPQQWQ